jgi:hypothetical protein
LNFILVSTTGRKTKATKIEVIRTTSTVVGIYFIKSQILPESIKPIGKNIEIVVKFHEIIGFQYDFKENSTLSHFQSHFFCHSSNHSITTIKLSTIIQRVRTSENDTILLNVYQIDFKAIKAIK